MFFFYGSLGLTREEGGTIVPGLVFYLFTFQIRVKGLYVYQLDQLTNCRVESSYTCLSALLPAIATCNCYLQLLLSLAGSTTICSYWSDYPLAGQKHSLWIA